MKLQQIQEAKSREIIARIARRYGYLAYNRLDPKHTPRAREYDSKRAALSVTFQDAPWLDTFEHDWLNNSDLPEELEPQAQKAVEDFAEKFAEDNGIPYTQIKANFRLVRITYSYE